MTAASTLSLIVASCAVVGVALLLTAAGRLRRRRLFSGSVHGLVALCFLLAAVAVGLLGAGLMSYQRLTQEQPAAEIRFRQLAAREFDAELAYPDGRTQRFELRGDEWQVDARVLKWREWVTLVGFDSAFRLERLTGRYTDIQDERTAPRTVHALNEPALVDPWQLARRFKSHLPWADALYGSATFLPMADGAAFEIKVTQSGLIARPLNPAAKSAVGVWQ